MEWQWDQVRHRVSWPYNWCFGSIPLKRISVPIQIRMNCNQLINQAKKASVQQLCISHGLNIAATSWHSHSNAPNMIGESTLDKISGIWDLPTFIYHWIIILFITPKIILEVKVRIRNWSFSISKPGFSCKRFSWSKEDTSKN